MCIRDRSNLVLKIDDGGRSAAGYKGKAGDCVVRSIAIVTNLPYQKVYDDLYKANEDFRKTSTTKLARSLKKKMTVQDQAHTEQFSKNTFKNWDGVGHLLCLLVKVVKFT